MRDTLQSHRVATGLWVVGGALVMYGMAMAVAKEMREFPGGPDALARSVAPAAEAMRPLRWPAERLDTLGGYLTYHNLTLVTLFLCVYGAIQGARAIRRSEDQHSLEEVLSTGWPRAAVLLDRALGFLVTLLAICLGLGVGVAVAMAGGGEPDVGGSFISVAVSGLAAMVAYALGLLLSQLTASSRSAAGLASLVLVVLYVGTNVADAIGPFGALRLLSPFHYANASRALVPGYGFDGPSSLALVGMAVVLLVLAAWAFARRDYAAPLWQRRRPAVGRPTKQPGRAAKAMAGSVWTASLWRGRVGLLVWTASLAAFMALMAGLLPAVMDMWSLFGQFLGATAEGAVTPEAQYLSFGAEVMFAVIAAYVVTQAATWVADLEQGRVEAVLAAPLSWTRLVAQRLLAVLVAVAVITLGGLVALAVGAVAVGAPVDLAGLARLLVVGVLFGWAMAAVAALVVAALRSTVAVSVLAAYLAASYLVSYLVPMLSWPEWLNRLSIFWAYGHPYLEWGTAGLVVLLTLATVGTAAAARTAEHTPKVA